MTDTFDDARRWETTSESRRTEIHIRQGSWLHLRRVSQRPAALRRAVVLGLGFNRVEKLAF